MPPTPYEKTKSGWSRPEERELLHLKGCRLRNAYKHKQERGVLTTAAQSLGSLRAENTETPAGSRPEERDFLQQAGAWIADDGCSKSRQPHRSKKTETPAGSRPEEREGLHLKGCRLRNAYKHKQERGVLTTAAQSLGSLRAEKTETPAGSRPEEPDFLQQAGAWIADYGCSKSRQPRIRKDRNTSRIKARRTSGSAEC